MKKDFFNLSHKHYLEVRSKLNPAYLDIYLYLATKYESLSEPLELNKKKLAKELNYHIRTVHLAVKRLNQLGLTNIISRKNTSIESEVRDRLVKNKLSSAITEVPCLAGRIDILTNTQIIEVKRINDWKSALGQILVYSAYYTEHRKRIHLFGTEPDRNKLLDIELSCSAFDVLVTFEVVGGIKDA